MSHFLGLLWTANVVACRYYKIAKTGAAGPHRTWGLNNKLTFRTVIIEPRVNDQHASIHMRGMEYDNH